MFSAHPYAGPPQVLFANFVALIWNTYLSFASHRGIEEEAPPEDTKGKKGKK